MSRYNFLSAAVAVILLSSCSATKNISSTSYIESPNDLKIEMVDVEGGRFNMKERVNDEIPQFSRDIIVDDFSISKYEITNRQYAIYCKQTGTETPKGLKKRSRKRPVVYIDWDSAIKFCKWLSEVTGENYRLPSEAEWEYAAMGANKSCGYDYAGSNDIDHVAWYRDNEKRLSRKRAYKIGKKEPNELGIYDMSGNVWEWCCDDFDIDYFNSCPVVNPICLDTYLTKSARGGGWCSSSNFSRVIGRDGDFSWKQDNDLGFRIVKVKKYIDLKIVGKYPGK